MEEGDKPHSNLSNPNNSTNPNNPNNNTNHNPKYNKPTQPKIIMGRAAATEGAEAEVAPHTEGGTATTEVVVVVVAKAEEAKAGVVAVEDKVGEEQGQTTP